MSGSCRRAKVRCHLPYLHCLHLLRAPSDALGSTRPVLDESRLRKSLIETTQSGVSSMPIHGGSSVSQISIRLLADLKHLPNDHCMIANKQFAASRPLAFHPHHSAIPRFQLARWLQLIILQRFFIESRFGEDSCCVR